MKRISGILMVLLVVALAWCWTGMVGCTCAFICAVQTNDNIPNKSRCALPPEKVAPDGQIDQRNRMDISVSSTPDLGLEVSAAKPSLKVETPAETAADIEKGTGDKDKPTTRPAAEAAEGGSRDNGD